MLHLHPLIMTWSVIERDQLTNGIFGKDRFRWWAWVSSSHFILSTDPELILAAFQEVSHPILHLRMDSFCVAANPPERRNIKTNVLMHVS